MGPTKYRELKRQGKLFNDGSPAKTLEGEGEIIWSRWDVNHMEWFALVKLKDGSEKYFWHSELSACDVPQL